MSVPYIPTELTHERTDDSTVAFKCSPMRRLLSFLKMLLIVQSCRWTSEGQIDCGKPGERERYFLGKRVLPPFPGAVLRALRGWRNGFLGVREGGGEDEVKTVGLGSTWRKKEKTGARRDSGVLVVVPMNSVAFLNLLAGSGPGLWYLVP